MALLEQPIKSPQTDGVDPVAARRVLTTGEWDDASALKIVVQDAQRAENFELTKQWVMAWPQAAVLYQSPYMSKYWEGTQTEQANVPFFTVATSVNSLVPQIMNGLFYDDPPFMIQKRPGTSDLAAKAVEEILAYQIGDIDFKRELRLGAINAVLFGTGIWKWGWETSTRERKTYRRKTMTPTVKVGVLPDVQIQDNDEEIEEVLTEEYIDRPTFEHIVNLRHLLVDPGLNVPDIRKAGYVVHRMYLTWDGLDKLRDRPGFTIPSREELLELFLPPVEMAERATAEVTVRNPLWDARAEPRYESTTIDPFAQPLEVLERWDNNKYIVVLQKKLVICNDNNPYGVIPFLSVGWWDVPESFWSLGLAKTIGSEQRIQQGVTNAWLNNLSLNLNGVYTRVRGKNAPTQSIRIAPGRIIDIEEQGDFTPLKRLDSIPEVGAAIQMSQARAESISGANELITQGSLSGGGRSSITRTASGANLMASGTGSRIQDFVEKIADQVIIPFLYAATDMNSALMPLSTLKYLLDQELQSAYKGDLLDILNARVKFNISAAARLQSRRNMAQALPILIQYITSPAIIQSLGTEGKKIKNDEILRMLWEVSDWKNFRDVIVDMTPEDQQRFMSQTPGAIAAMQNQGKQKLEDQKFKNKRVLNEDNNVARAGNTFLKQAGESNLERAQNEVARQTIERSATNFETEGQPGNQGFGDVQP
jgi:hypothetical protein